MSNIPNTTNLNVRVDSTLKQESDMLFKNLGLNMTTAINMFLTKCVKTSSIPFKIEEPKPSKKSKNKD
jgi:DNA-damage-inducible protein J